MDTLSTAIRFTDEQAMLLETATEFCRDKSPVAAVRAQIPTEQGYDGALWQEIVALGWTGITVPERFGGSGLSAVKSISTLIPTTPCKVFLIMDK